MLLLPVQGGFSRRRQRSHWELKASCGWVTCRHPFGSYSPLLSPHFSFYLEIFFLMQVSLFRHVPVSPLRATVIKKFYSTSNSSLTNTVKVTFSKPLNPWLPHWTGFTISQASVCSHSPQLSVVEPRTVSNAWRMSVSAQIPNFCKFFSGKKMNSIGKQIQLNRW